jgi:hypothetical protein
MFNFWEGYYNFNINYVDDVDNVLFRNILFFSSMIFTTNILVSYYKKDYIYGFFFFMLLVTSLIIHYNDYNLFLNLIDKVSIVCVSTYGGYVLCKKIKEYLLQKEKNNIIIFIVIISLFTFLFDIYVYFYGYVIQDFCFHENKIVGNAYHMLMHLLSSVIHNCIILI